MVKIVKWVKNMFGCVAHPWMRGASNGNCSLCGWGKTALETPLDVWRISGCVAHPKLIYTHFYYFGHNFQTVTPIEVIQRPLESLFRDLLEYILWPFEVHKFPDLYHSLRSHIFFNSLSSSASSILHSRELYLLTSSEHLSFMSTRFQLIIYPGQLNKPAGNVAGQS